jgi:O-succinylbenzoate synthase
MLSLEVRPYCRPFRTPLQTAHGLWRQREGWLLQVTDADSGQVHWGEIAPLPWFGTETLAQAQDFCDRWPRQFSPTHLSEIPDTLPACQFGFGITTSPEPPFLSSRAALNATPETRNRGSAAHICALLPAGAAALNAWPDLWALGHRTFKWKIGVGAIAPELSLFQQLVEGLPTTARLRLDANGGLTADNAERWLAACDTTQAQVEYLEQPLPPADILPWLRERTSRFKTAIALDESVATFQQLQQVYEQVGNRVVYVVKPAIAGFPDQLLNFCLQHQLDVVFSSALETPIGRHAVLALAQSLWAAGLPQRALGLGVSHWFADDWDTLSEEALWSRL